MSLQLEMQLLTIKMRDVDLAHPIRIKYLAGVDAGGLSRQFYSDVMMHIKDKMNTFEGPVATSLILAYSSAGIWPPEDSGMDSGALPATRT